MRIQQIDEATLLAYLEEALDATQRARVSAALQAEPTLQARLDSLQRLRSGLRATFNAVDYLPSPHATIWERIERRTRRRWPGWYSFGVAVSVVLIGVILGRDVFASILPVFKFVSGQPAPGTILQEPTSAIPSDGGVQQPALPIRGTLAYIRDDALWVKQLSDSFERRIDEDAEINTPHWSSSAQWLAYRKGDQIWVAPSSGGDTRVVHDGADLVWFDWSPVADQLAYTTEDNRLHVLDINEWRAQEISGRNRSVSLPEWMPFTWSPDGEWLAYSVEIIPKTESDEYLRIRRRTLIRVRVDGSEAYEVFGDNTGNATTIAARSVAWTQDGQQILFWDDTVASPELDSRGGTSLYAIPADGGEPRMLVQDLPLGHEFLDVTSDTQALVVTEGAGWETWLNKHITLIDLESGESTRLTDGDVAAISPAWAPNNQIIAYVTESAIEADRQNGSANPRSWMTKRDNGLANRRIWLMDRDGANQRQITNDPNYRDERPIWLNSDQLLFARLDHQAQSSLWIVQRDGSGLTQVIPNLQQFNNDNDVMMIDWDRFFAIAPVEQAP